MPVANKQDARILAGSRGYRAVAEDGPLGKVDTALCPPESDEPDFLVIRVGARLGTRLPVLSTALVVDVDSTERLVRLAGSRERLRRLPEYLPLAI